MKKSDFYFDLPEELIAQTPLEQRDASRLLLLDKNTGATEHKHFYDLPDYLEPGDCLVLNDSRVLPARLMGNRMTGGAVEVLLLRDLGEGKWECLTRPGRKTQPGVELTFGEGKLTATVTDRAERWQDAVMPGYTHLQRAQPITFGHHLMAYAMMLLRDVDRMQDAAIRMNVSPIGCCALAGTTYDTDRWMEAIALGFDAIALNSLDGVSDRDFCVELLSAYAILMMHLSRLSEELILWSSWEFQFVSLSDAYTTGSSIMPQKKNPDMAELVRGKTGRVYGDLMALLTTLKGLPLAYNKDMQEDKECVFDACDTVKLCLRILTPMIATMTVSRTLSGEFAGSLLFSDCSSFAKNVVALTSVFVTQNYRGLGIARELFSRGISSLKEHGIHQIIIADSALPDFLEPLIARCGFEKTGSVYVAELD